MGNENKSLEKAKKQHFEMLRKNNAITDAKNGELSLGAMKSLDVILQVYHERQDRKIHLELSYLRKKLGLEKNNDYVDRIKTYLLELKLPFELRDFNDVKSGKKVSWALTSFLNEVKSYKETQHLVEINISESFIEYMVDRAGYTNIDLSLSKKFKTKYGYKIYEMYLRYYSMPNRIDKQLGTITKNIEELNDKFGTKHKHASKMLEGLNRGIQEILKLTGEEIFCTYDKVHKNFVFSWAKNLKKVESRCKVPNARVDELVDWIIEHTKQKINNMKHYRTKIKKLILEDEYEDFESFYRGMMIHKYGYLSNEVDDFRLENGKYKDFPRKKEQTPLF
jgi:hypothetical protein